MPEDELPVTVAVLTRLLKSVVLVCNALPSWLSCSILDLVAVRSPLFRPTKNNTRMPYTRTTPPKTFQFRPIVFSDLPKSRGALGSLGPGCLMRRCNLKVLYFGVLSLREPPA